MFHPGQLRKRQEGRLRILDFMRGFGSGGRPAVRSRGAAPSSLSCCSSSDSGPVRMTGGASFSQRICIVISAPAA
ncbi:hypothetical protein LJK87_20505 [Paenibacillus sp. P25]|nr:hypothetical protein LJK87_20505 [Paenibacillus sp. P25]